VNTCRPGDLACHEWRRPVNIALRPVRRFTPSKGWSVFVAALALGVLASLPALDAFAHPQSKFASTIPSVTFARFVPNAILNDGLSSTRLEVYGGPSAASVELHLTGRFRIGAVTGCDGTAVVPLSDAGTIGDEVAADGVYSVDNVRRDLGCADTGYQWGGVVGVRRYIVGDIVIEYVDGSSLTFDRLGFSLNVLDSAEFTSMEAVRQLSPDVQAGSHVLNIRDDSFRVESVLGRWDGNPDLHPLTQQLFAVTEGDFELLNLIGTVQLRCGGACVGGNHSQVQVNYSGTGLSQFDDSTAYGSAGALLGINAIEGTNYDSANIVLHETVHQWAAYLAPSLGLSGGAHWNYNSSVGGVAGGCLWHDTGNGTFTSQGHWGYLGKLAPIELYLMGLLPAANVPPLVWSENGSQAFCTPGTAITGPFHVVDINQIVATHGPRAPGPGGAPSLLRMAVIVTSQGRLLNPLEMTLYNRLAQQIEGEIASETYVTMDEATDGRASLKTSLAEALPAQLVSDYYTGAPGSIFNFLGSYFDPGVSIELSVNGFTLGSLVADGDGEVVFRVNSGNADPGYYHFRAISGNTTSTMLILDPSLPVRQGAGTGPLLELPAGLAWTNAVYLPTVKR
jgi:hypothetical protein